MFEAYQKEEKIEDLITKKDLPSQFHVIMAYQQWTEAMEKAEGSEEGLKKYK